MEDSGKNKKIDLVDWITIVISIVALGWSAITYFDALRRSKVEYEILESMRYEHLKMVADLKSMQSKAQSAIKQKKGDKNDYSKELSDITSLKTNPGYYIILLSLKDELSRYKLESNLLCLSNNIESLSPTDKNKYIGNSLRILHENTDLNKHKKLKLDELIEDLCQLNIVNVRGNKLFNTQGVIKQASFGSTLSVLKKEKTGSDSHASNDLVVIDTVINGAEKLNEQKGSQDTVKIESVEAFLDYLIYEKEVNDADVNLLYGVMVNNDSIISVAVNKGGDINVTVEEIIEQYKTEYEEFVSKPYSIKGKTQDNSNDWSVNENNESGLVSYSTEGHGRLFNAFMLISAISTMIMSFYITKIVRRYKREKNRMKIVDEKVEDANIAMVELNKQRKEEINKPSAMKDPEEVEENDQSNEETLANEYDSPLSKKGVCDATETDTRVDKAIKLIKAKEKEKEEEDDSKTIKMKIEEMDALGYYLEQAQRAYDNAKDIKTKQQSTGKTANIGA